MPSITIEPIVAKSMPKSTQKEWIAMMMSEQIPVRTRAELTGMLPEVIKKVEILLSNTAVLIPVVVKGYDATAGKDSFFYWGVACRIQCSDMPALKTAALSLGFQWLSDLGDIAYTGGRTIAEFQTFRVNGSLELMPEKEKI